jgi:hypothetical protein
MGSLGRLFESSLGKVVFLRILLIKTAPESPRGRPFEAAKVILFGGMWASVPTFEISSIHSLPTKKQ